MDAGWMKDGLCVDHPDLEPDDWFPEQAQTRQNRQAVVECVKCPVHDECLAYARHLKARYGVWGGVNMASRKARK